MTASDFALHRLTHGCGAGFAESAAFIVLLDPRGFGDLEGDDDLPLGAPPARDPRTEKLRDWRREGRPRVKARAAVDNLHGSR